ncbi:Bifunctional aspartate kinase/homoserine dehydrogenase I [Sulfidibacter corallicola]|uniref:Bifunctional aspartate kinase/homoserine dehydrogenase I n=1 Tax=Sulfidibacter corallicola TaxID=2818388 RepID=A0A8A4TTW7_SULCO|nr:bifunctional aspartate kinase/homoserine dehydrogenase I [Sulfidibacter corallicola]QTD53409.1 bifunctional aspartate kinase/homoserine dehydrogenase I [Sulfidibacter corallicola]
MIVMKFGGSSLGTPARVRAVMDIVANARRRFGAAAVVCSAFGGATDQLISMGKAASSGSLYYQETLHAFEKRHLDAVAELFPNGNRSAVEARIRNLVGDLSDVLHGIFLVRELTARTQDFITSFGERLSARIIAEALAAGGLPAEYLDARTLIRTDDRYGSARVQFEDTNRRITEYFEKHDALQIVTGFIAASDQQQTTTLGRGGSDYTASIFGAALGAHEIQIWTDVDGVLTADPRKVGDAFPIPEISYEEAMEMAHFGAKVIYPPTMAPAMTAGIPLRIKNTFQPEAAGTLVGRRVEQDHPLPACGLSSIDHVTLLQLKGCGLFGAAGVANRLFGALARASVNIILISQGSSEHSICVAVAPTDAHRARKAADEEFALELMTKQVDPIAVEENKSVIAVVGDQMRRVPGIAGRVFNALGANQINVVAIAQGSSERNVSFVVRHEDLKPALHVLHQAIFFPLRRTLHLFLVGIGLVGRELVQQIAAKEAGAGEEQPRIRVVGLANSKKMIFDPNGLGLDDLEGTLARDGLPMDGEALLARAQAMQVSDKILVDLTASDVVPRWYEPALRSGISVVTANKKANTAEQAYFDKLKSLVSCHGASFLYETNVGAGLPVIRPLKDLIAGGDAVAHIEGMLSGTLSYLFNAFDGSRPFSELVLAARDSGFTEPDPREDLNGMDVARKLLILARECGHRLELDDLEVESLIPEELRGLDSAEDFMARLSEADAMFEGRRTEAAENGQVLRYIARFADGKGVVSLQAVGSDHPFYHTRGSDNLVSYTTRRYATTPMVIKGPGAGAVVTAGGVLADILQVGRGH